MRSVELREEGKQKQKFGILYTTGPETHSIHGKEKDFEKYLKYQLFTSFPN